MLEEFLETKGYVTPKLGTRAAIIKDNKILLVKETVDGLWSMPGGWMDNQEDINSNIIKEVKEESGLDVETQKVVAIITKKSAGTSQNMIQNMVTILMLCDEKGGEFQKNIETSEIGYFSLDALPPLSVKRNTFEQIKMCFEAYEDKNWKTIYE